MYAAVMNLKIEPGLAPAAASAFAAQLLPRVKAAAGFRSGYWLEPCEGRGLGLVLFDDEDQARSACSPEQWEAPGVTIESVVFRRVAATG